MVANNSRKLRQISSIQKAGIVGNTDIYFLEEAQETSR